MAEIGGFKRSGVTHLWTSLAYSISGARYLLREQSARHEVLMLAATIGVFAVIGASLNDYLILGALFALVLCAEAINTAGEMIVDRISPEISEFAKQAKDLLSFAVFCTLFLYGWFAMRVLITALVPVPSTGM